MMSAGLKGPPHITHLWTGPSGPPSALLFSRMKSLLTLSLAMAFVVSLSAQWPHFKRADVPRLPDGKVNLTAPAPTFFDGHPDLSGVWENPGWREGAAASGVITGVGGAPTTRSEPVRRGPAEFLVQQR